MKQLVTVLLVVFIFRQSSIGQHVGNQAFERNNERGYRYYSGNNDKGGLMQLFLTDSTMLVQAKVLKNVKADYYIAVFGLSQEDKSVVDANRDLNLRVRNFINAIKTTGIKDADIYTDIITQYRIYDVKKTADNTFEEYLAGFELSKNVIVKYQQTNHIEKLLLAAAKDSIFDLIKVDYIIEDISAVYEELFLAASEVAKKKKNLYINLSGMQVKPNCWITAEHFTSYYPAEMYKSYKAYSSNYYESYSWAYDRKKAKRKFETFYYDQLDHSGFDKVINPAVLEPTIQFAFTLQVKYDFKK